jgi:hypothetical protein
MAQEKYVMRKKVACFAGLQLPSIMVAIIER